MTATIEVQEAFREVWKELVPFLQTNVDLHGRRFINGGEPTGDFDFVRKIDIKASIRKETDIILSPLGPLANSVRGIQVATFALRPTPFGHTNEIFIASDQSYVGWVSTGSAWIYLFGVNAVAQSGIAAVTALLGTNDAGYLFNITDFTHLLRWSGSALGFAPGDNGSLYLQDFPSTPPGGTWGLCDGSTYTYLKADGTTASFVTKNLTGHYRKSVTSGADATASAIAPLFTGTAATLTGSVSAPTFTGAIATLTGSVAAIAATGTPAQTTSSAAGQNTADQGHTHPAPALTMNSYTPGGTNSAPILTMNSYTPAGTNDALGEPISYKVLTYVRR